MAHWNCDIDVEGGDQRRVKKKRHNRKKGGGTKVYVYLEKHQEALSFCLR